MRIKSDFRDYYDYVEFLYSPEGGDKNNTYSRVITESHIEIRGSIPYPPFPSTWIRASHGKKVKNKYDGWLDFPWRFKWCFVCGKLYLLVSDSRYCVDRYGQDTWFRDLSKFRLLTVDHPCIEYLFAFNNRKDTYNGLCGFNNSTCHSISKEIMAPVFVIHAVEHLEHFHGTGSYMNKVIIHESVPNLGQLGFAPLIPPDKMYQDISVYMGQLRNSPDNNPPVNVGDKDRLVQKGFDAKLSFRGKVPNRSKK